MTKQMLISFCKKYDIFVPPDATVSYLKAAIVRSFYNDKEIKGLRGCFGAWMQDDTNCVMCDFKEKCATASLGMDRDKYFKAFERELNPKIRLKNSASRFSRRSRKRK